MHRLHGARTLPTSSYYPSLLCSLQRMALPRLLLRVGCFPLCCRRTGAGLNKNLPRVFHCCDYDDVINCNAPSATLIIFSCAFALISLLLYASFSVTVSRCAMVLSGVGS